MTAEIELRTTAIENLTAAKWEVAQNVAKGAIYATALDNEPGGFERVRRMGLPHDDIDIALTVLSNSRQIRWTATKLKPGNNFPYDRFPATEAA
jgi:hypothetical protein